MTYVTKASSTAIGLVFAVLAIVSLAIRAAGWRRYTRKLEIDDVLIVPAALLTILAGMALVIGAQLNIIGGHTLDGISETENHKLGKFEYAFWIGHLVTIGTIKLALLFLFRRIFKGRAYRTIFDYTNWTLIVLVVLWTLVFLFFEIFACGKQPDASWSSLSSLRSSKCVNTFALQTGCAVFSWVLDLVILIEPLFMILPMTMDFRKKLQVCLVFLCSTFAVVAGLLRMIAWIQLYIEGSTNERTEVLGTTLPSIDQEGIISIFLFWTYIEIGVGFQVACLPPCARHLEKITSLSRLLNRVDESVSSLITRSRRPRPSSNPSDTDASKGAAVGGIPYKASTPSSRSHRSSGALDEDQMELYTVEVPGRSLA